MKSEYSGRIHIYLTIDFEIVEESGGYNSVYIII